MDKASLPEAPSSVTYSIKRKGFNILFTVRAMSGVELIAQMDAIEEKLLEKGYEPQMLKASVPSYGKKEQSQQKSIVFADGKKCPDCGSRVVVAQTKDGRKFFKCEKQVYNFKTRETSGCLYFQWDTGKTDDPTDDWQY